MLSEGKITNQNFLSLTDFIDDIPLEEIAQLYNSQFKSEISDQFSQDFGYITEEEIKKFFTLDKLGELQENHSLSDEIIKTYTKLHFSNKEIENAFGDDVSKYLNLYDLGILNIDSLIEIPYLTVEKLLYYIDHNNNYDYTNFLISLYNNGNLEADELLYRISEEQVYTACSTGTLPTEILKSYLPEDIIKAFNKKKLSDKIIMCLYNDNFLTFDHISLAELPQADIERLLPSLSTEKIKELFLKEIIGYDELKSLLDNGHLSQKDFEDICHCFNIQGAMDEIRRLSNIENTAETTGTGEGGGNVPKNPPSGKMKTHKINPELRVELIEKLGCTDTLPIISGALKGYTFYAVPGLEIVILEKTVNSSGTEAIGHATYVLPIIKAIELAKNSNKQDLRQEKNVYCIYHTKNWGNKLLEVVSNINSRFKYDSSYQNNGSEILALVAKIKETYEKGER